jgi:signal peptidase II
LNKIKERKLYLLIIFLVLSLDLVSKFIIKSIFSVDKFRTITVIKKFFNIIYTENRGAIWGSFQQYSFIITIISILALIFIIVYFFRIPKECKTEILAFSLVCGGALGNISQRVFQGYVVDFIDMYHKKFHWATFNIADSFISIGIVILIISIIFSHCPDKNKILEE